MKIRGYKLKIQARKTGVDLDVLWIANKGN